MALRAVVDHPKFSRLQKRLGFTKFQTLGLLEAIWHFTAKFCPAGNIGKYSDDEIESWIEWTGEPGALAEVLCQCGWLDANADHRLIVHDWSQHVDDAIHMSLARTITRFSDGSIPKMSRLSATDKERILNLFDAQCAHTKRTKSARSAVEGNGIEGNGREEKGREKPMPPSADIAPDRFEEFWDAFPKRSGSSSKKNARTKFALKSKTTDPQAIIDGAIRYKAFCDSNGNIGTPYVKAAEAWLNGEFWESEYLIQDNETEDEDDDLSPHVRAALENARMKAASGLR